MDLTPKKRGIQKVGTWNVRKDIAAEVVLFIDEDGGGPVAVVRSNLGRDMLLDDAFRAFIPKDLHRPIAGAVDVAIRERTELFPHEMAIHGIRSSSTFEPFQLLSHIKETKEQEAKRKEEESNQYW